MKAVSVLMALLVAASTYAWNEPDGFRGVPWGTPEAEVRERLKVRMCMDSVDKTLSDRSCMDLYGRVGDVPVKLAYEFRNDRLIGVSIIFESKAFSTLEGIFIQRYGQPTETAEAEIQNRMGARFTNRIHNWTGERIRIRLARYAGKVTEGLAWIMQADVIDEWLKRRGEQHKKGAGDL